MSQSKPVVGIIATAQENREIIIRQLQSLQFDCFTVELDNYPASREDTSLRQIVEAAPRIVIVDMQHRDTAITTLRLLHDELPEAWLFISAAANDPNLIIDTMHAGAREFLPRPSTLEKLAAALERYIVFQQKSSTATRGKIYGLTSAKGGAGTTSSAVNLAVATATAPNIKVALADLGTPVGDVADYLDLKTKYTITDVASATNRLDQVLLESYMSSVQGVSVLPGNREFLSGIFRYDFLDRMFKVLSESFTYTFVDMACACDQDQIQAATEYCDVIMMFLTPELPALWRTDRLIRLFNQSNVRNKIRLVLNRANMKYEINAKEIEQTLGYSIFWRLPNNYPETIEAVNTGKPLVSFSKSKLATSYMELAQELTGLPLVKKKKGFLGL